MRDMGDSARYIHPEIWARWFQIAGEQLYMKTFPRMYKNRILTIGVSNSSWMQELSFMRNQLIDRLDETIGPGAVTEIRFVLDTSVGKNRIVQPIVAPKPLPQADPERLSKELLDAANKIDDPELSDLVKRAASRYTNKK